MLPGILIFLVFIAVMYGVAFWLNSGSHPCNTDRCQEMFEMRGNR